MYNFNKDKPAELLDDNKLDVKMSGEDAGRDDDGEPVAI